MACVGRSQGVEAMAHQVSASAQGRPKGAITCVGIQLREQLRVSVTGSSMQDSETVLNKLGPVTAKVSHFVAFLYARSSDSCVHVH